MLGESRIEYIENLFILTGGITMNDFNEILANLKQEIEKLQATNKALEEENSILKSQLRVAKGFIEDHLSAIYDKKN